MTVNHPLLCASALILHFAMLSMLVSLVRNRSKTLFGTRGDDMSSLLYRSVRAHGNSAEYLSAFLPALLFLAAGRGANTPLWLCYGIVGSRVVHAAGILLSQDPEKSHPLRVIGTVGTYGCLVRVGTSLARAAVG